MKTLILLSFALAVSSCDCMYCKPETKTNCTTFVCQRHHDSLRLHKTLHKKKNRTNAVDLQRAYDMSTTGTYKY